MNNITHTNAPKAALKGLFEVAYRVARKGRPYSDCKDLIELEMFHRVNLLPNNVPLRWNCLSRFYIVFFFTRRHFQYWFKRKTRTRQICFGSMPWLYWQCCCREKMFLLITCCHKDILSYAIFSFVKKSFISRYWRNKTSH